MRYTDISVCRDKSSLVMVVDHFLDAMKSTVISKCMQGLWNIPKKNIVLR